MPPSPALVASITARKTHPQIHHLIYHIGALSKGSKVLCLNLWGGNCPPHPPSVYGPAFFVRDELWYLKSRSGIQQHSGDGLATSMKIKLHACMGEICINNVPHAVTLLMCILQLSSQERRPLGSADGGITVAAEQARQTRQLLDQYLAD